MSPDHALREFVRRLEELAGAPLDESLLRRALTHPSYAYEQRLPDSNQRLEFLGDAVLGFVVADMLYRVDPPLDEGQMTPARIAVVQESALARAARRIGIDRCLLLGVGEERSGGRDKPSVLSDAFEAVIAAVYLAAGEATARSLIEASLDLEESLARGEAGGPAGDARTELQEHLHRMGRPSPEYLIEGRRGPDHAPTFTVSVWDGPRLLARAEGPSKKAACVEAARQALQKSL